MRALIAVPVLAMALWLATAVSGLANSTHVTFCNRDRAPVYAVVYEKKGIRAPALIGWYKLTRSGRCLKEPVGLYERRAYAFAALNKDGRLVPLKYQFRKRGWFSGTLDSVCIPVQETLKSFTSPAGLTPPCRAGTVPVPVSLNVRGGNKPEFFEFEIFHPSRLPPPDPAYMKAWEAAFGVPAKTKDPVKPRTNLSPKPSIDLGKVLAPKTTTAPETKPPAKKKPSAFGSAFSRPTLWTWVSTSREKLEARCKDPDADPICDDFDAWKDKHAVRSAALKQRSLHRQTCVREKSGGGMTFIQQHDKSHQAMCKTSRDALKSLEASIEEDAFYALEERLLEALGNPQDK